MEQQEGGYPASMFLAPPQEELICSICMEVLRDPLQVCSEHHNYCRGCIAKWKATNDTCPECRAPFSREEPARVLNNMIEKLDVRCSVHACNGGSSTSAVSADAEDVEDGHQHKKSRQDDSAGPSSVPATSCGWSGKLKDYEAPVAACPFVEVPCPFADAGCAFRAARRDIGAHSSDMGAHFLILMTTVAAGKAECAAVKAEGAAQCAAVKAECAAQCAAVKVECAALKAEGRVVKVEHVVMKRDISSLQRYVSTLQASGEEAAAGGMEWVSSRTVPAAGGTEGYIYTGQMRAGVSHGFGRANEEYFSYDGQWKEGKYHGRGCWEFMIDRNCYDGQWEEDLMHGQGVYKHRNGESEEGYQHYVTMSLYIPLYPSTLMQSTQPSL
jgi:hypothetical protein